MTPTEYENKWFVDRQSAYTQVVGSVAVKYTAKSRLFSEIKENAMQYSSEIQSMCPIQRGELHPSAPIPVEGQMIRPKEVIAISGLSHGVGTCAPQQGAAKLTLNVKQGIIEEALIETIGCSGMTHSASMAAEILTGKTILEALNTDCLLYTSPSPRDDR